MPSLQDQILILDSSYQEDYSSWHYKTFDKEKAEELIRDGYEQHMQNVMRESLTVFTRKRARLSQIGECEFHFNKVGTKVPNEDKRHYWSCSVHNTSDEYRSCDKADEVCQSTISLEHSFEDCRSYQ